MQCFACGAHNPDGAGFCGRCGRPCDGRPEVICPACHTVLPSQARFCFGCGASVKPASGPTTPSRPIPSPLNRLLPPQYVERVLEAQGRVRGERRVVTILFSDVSDSTALGENLDPESVMAIMNGAFEVLIEPVYRYEGTLARLMGDAILAFFGAPIAHEDDPVRACRAALDIIEGAERYGERLRREQDIPNFKVRVGINTGIVVVGEVGADLRVEYTAMGDAVNLAARMESAAEPGTIFITEDTRRLVAHHFRTESIGALQVKGRIEPVCTHRLLAVRRESGDQDPAWQRPRTPFTGRTEELERLRQACRKLADGHGGRVAIVGEAGLGKTRLVAEAQESRPTSVAWVWGRAHSFEGARPYGLAQRVLTGLLDLDGDDPTQALHESVRRVVPERAGCVAPYLARLFDIDASTPGPAESPDVVRRRVTQAFRELVRAFAARQPLVLVWEDLQRADSSSLELIRALAALPDTVPLLLVLILRPDKGPIHQYHRQLMKRYAERYQIIELSRLTRDETLALLDALMTDERTPAWVRQQLIERTEGNPFYLEELAWAVRDCPDRHAFASEGRNGAPTNVPATLQAAMMSRLDRLAPAERRVLQIAGVIGRVFPVDVLRYVLGEESSSAELGLTLGTLERRDILRQVADGSAQEYSFTVALMAEVAAGSLLLAESRLTHGRIAEALEELRASKLNPFASTIAEHYEQAGVTDRAREYWVRAATGAARLAADTEALGYFQRALSLADDAAPADLRMTIHEGLADASCRIASYADAARHYDLALALAGAPIRRIGILRKIGTLHERSGRYSDALQSFHAALSAMGQDLDEEELSRIYCGLGLVHARLGAHDAALEMTRLALVLQEKLGDEAAIAQTCNNLGNVLCARSEFDAAIDHHRRALVTWDRLGDFCGLAASHNNLGLAYAGRRDHAAALEHYNLAASFFERAGNAHGIARALDNLGRTCFELGREDEAMTHLGRAVAILDELAVSEGEPAPEMWQSGSW